MIKAVFFGASLCALSLSLGAGQAWAATSPDVAPAGDAQAAPAPAPTEPTPTAEASARTDRSGSAIGDIVVTARRRAENAQKVPISITVLTGESLAQQSAVKLTDVKRLTPNLYLSQGNIVPGGIAVGIRGQFQNDTIITLDPSVGIYVDGVYWARSQGANVDLLDVSRVEVLKGPQGTLFGRNTTGGAVNVTTANPDPTKVSGMIQGRIGNFDQHDEMAVINLPLVKDKLAIRLAGNKIDAGPMNRNLNLGILTDTQNTYTMRAKVLYRPIDDLSIVASYEHFGLAQKPQVTKLGLVQPGGPGEIQAALQSGGCLKAFNPACPGAFVPGSVSLAQYGNPSDFYSTYSQYEDIGRAHTNTVGLTIEYTLPFATLKYVGAYRSVKSDTGRVDYDGSPINALDTRQITAAHQWSHELQLNGDLFQNKLKYTLGGYLFREAGEDQSFANSLPALNPNNPSHTDGLASTKSWAVFAQASYSITDALSFTGGLRYSQDKKGLDLRSDVKGVCVVRVGNPPVLIPPTQACDVPLRRTDSAVSYLASLDYKITPNILVYGKTSKGYRAGGFNLRGLTPTTYGGFAPETVTDYEVGVKSDLFDRHVRFNLSAFYSDYSNLQRSVLLPNGIGGVATTTINAASATIKGLEAELTVRPVAGLEFSGTLGITDPKYKKFTSVCPVPYPTTAIVPCVNGIFDRSHEHFERTPETTFSVSASYTHDVPLGTATLRGDYSYTGTFYFVNLTETLAPAYVPGIKQNGYGLLNGRLSWDLASPDVTLALYVRNLTKQKYNTFALDFVTGGLGYTINNPGVPRQFGIEGTFRF